MRSVLLFSFLTFCFVGYGQIINFSDVNFKNALVNTLCVDTNGDLFGDVDADTNNDGEIDIFEALEVKRLFLNSQGISIIKEISYFANLTSLNVRNNMITSLDVNDLIKLRGLECQNNKLDTLIIDKCPELTGINCSGNKINMMEIRNAPYISFLDCARNKLTELDVSNMVYISQLLCNSNQLSKLNVSALPELWNLYCYENNLSSLLIKNGRKIDQLNFEKNSNLSYICCDDKQNNFVRNLANIFNLPNLEINSYCSFSPGGKYYTVKGSIIYDADGNGCSIVDSKIPSIKFSVFSGSNKVEEVISNQTGSYKIELQEGTYSIAPTFSNPNAFKVNPDKKQVSFASWSQDTITQNFCVTNNDILSKMVITVIPLSPPARPGFDASYKIVWENVGNQIEGGTLNFTYDERLLDYISATQTADQVADGIIKWNFSNLLPFEKREITVTLKVNRPTDTPAVNAGDKLYLTASILDNIFTLENTVVGSYDPNDKTCLQGDRVKPDMVGKYVDYLIRFENTGNYAAENVVVKDIIDTKTFDVSTLKITDASHEVYTRIEGNKVEFIFENIQLPFDDANNDGYIAFKIKTLPSLVLGDSLKNLADIYFDYNFPIRTNETQTTVALPVFTKDITTEVNIYPNPVSDILYLDNNDNWSKAEIFDIAGRIIRSISLDTSSMDVSGLESGTYFIRLKDGERVGVVKFVKL